MGIIRTSEEIDDIINTKLGRFLCDPAYIISDEEFYCPSVEKVNKILKKNNLNTNEWVSEKFDCDDFALILKSAFVKRAWKNKKRRKPYACGILHGDSTGEGYHAINFVICDDGELYLIEPQNDELSLPSKDFDDIYFIYI